MSVRNYLERRCQSAMRRSSPIIFLWILGSATFANAEPPQKQDWATLCISRSGEMGRVNVEPVTIRLGDAGSELTIHGEEEACVTSYPEEFATISLRFRYPYYGPGEKLRYWETAPVTIAVKPGATTRIKLCERAKQVNNSTRWHHMWVLSPPESPSICANWSK
jgi:hypothetical protein